jgi:hypothetical protein
MDPKPIKAFAKGQEEALAKKLVIGGSIRSTAESAESSNQVV